jgi:hypothetical protein
VNIPFFTAEASLYKHNGNYRSAALSLRGEGVFPQACSEKCLKPARVGALNRGTVCPL